MGFRRTTKRTTKRRPSTKRRTFKRRASTKRRTFKTTGRKRAVSRKRKLLPKLTHREINRNVIHPRTHMKMASEIVVGEILLASKTFLAPSTANTFGSLIFQMNAIEGPGTYNTGVGAAFNELPLTNTTAMPNYMGAFAQAQRYAYALPTWSSISVTITMSLVDFQRTGSTGTTAIYDATYDDVYYFCLVPYNSGFNSETGVASLQLMPWAQVIRQPGARRCTVHGKGRNTATLRASTSIGKIEGTPSWETDVGYRAQSEDGAWSEPSKGPFWMLYAYYPYSGWGESQPTFEVNVKLGMHATFFQPKIATLYTALQPGESKAMVTDSDTLVIDDDTKDEPDDDDPSLLDFDDVKISDGFSPPPLVRQHAIAHSLSRVGAAGAPATPPHPPGRVARVATPTR